MDEEEDDDIYAPADVSTSIVPEAGPEKAKSATSHDANEDLEDGEEEGEEVEEDASDSVPNPANIPVHMEMLTLSGHRHHNGAER